MAVWTRRAFLASTGAAAGVVALAAAGCSGDDDDNASSGDTNGKHKPKPKPPKGDGVVNLAHVPSEAAIFGWINEVVGHGIRRPGYDADIWVETFVRDKFKDLGLEKVRLEPVSVRRWEPKRWKLEAL